MIKLKYGYLNGTLIQEDWCPYKKRKRHQVYPKQRDHHVKIQQEGGHLEAKERGLGGS